MKYLFQAPKARSKNSAGAKRPANGSAIESVTQTTAAARMNDEASSSTESSQPVNLSDYRIFDWSYCRVIMEDQYVCGGRYGQCHRVGHNLTFSRAPSLHAYELRKPQHGDANSRSIDGILFSRVTLNDYLAYQSADGGLNQQSQPVSAVGPVLDKKKAPEDEGFGPFPKHDVLLCTPSKAYLTPANSLYRGLGLPRSLKLDVDIIKGLLHDKLKLEFGNSCPRPTFWIGADCVLNEKHWTYKDKEDCWKPGTGRTFVLQGARATRSYEVVEATDYCILKDNFHKKRPAAGSPTTTAQVVDTGKIESFGEPAVQSSSNITMEVAASATATASPAIGKSNPTEKKRESIGIDSGGFEDFMYGMSIETASKRDLCNESRNSVDALLTDVSGMSISQVGTFPLPTSSTIDMVPDAMTIIAGGESTPIPVHDVELPVGSKEEDPLSTLTTSQLH